MRILDFEVRELSVKREWTFEPSDKPKTVSLEVERLKRTSPELFDPSLYHNRQPWSFEEYRKRKALMAQADTVLALAVGFNQGFEARVQFAARMYEVPIFERRRRRKLRLV